MRRARAFPPLLTLTLVALVLSGLAGRVPGGDRVEGRAGRVTDRSAGFPGDEVVLVGLPTGQPGVAALRRKPGNDAAGRSRPLCCVVPRPTRDDDGPAWAPGPARHLVGPDRGARTVGQRGPPVGIERASR